MMRNIRKIRTMNDRLRKSLEPMKCDVITYPGLAPILDFFFFFFVFFPFSRAASAACGGSQAN